MSYPSPSYPPVLYPGSTGEQSASVRRADAEPELVFPNGNRVSLLSTGASTGGLFGLYRWEFSSARSGPGPHFHRTMAESFFVLSGTVTVYDGAAWVPATAGDYLHVPPGGVHGFRNDSGRPASMLLHFAPGGPREAYFAGLAEVAASGEPLSPEAEAEFMARHDNIWVD